MPGNAKTTQFHFSTATLMIAPMTVAAGINPIDHSIGLVKKVDFSLDTGFVELTQGLTNQVIASMVNKQAVKCSAEVYELTSRNLAYGLGLDATSKTSYVPNTEVGALSAAVAGGATSFSVAGDVSTEMPVGAWGFLQEGQDDAIHIFKVKTVAYTAPNSTITVDPTYAVPQSMSFSTAAGRLGALTKVDCDPSLANQMFTVRIAGITAMDKRPIVLHMPKAKLTKGFAINFDSSNWGNLPFEIDPYVPVPTDEGYSSDFSQLFSVIVP